MNDYVVHIAADFDPLPLRRFACLVAGPARGGPGLPFAEIEPELFMHVATAVGVSVDHRILQYKHRITRRYLNLDDAAHAFMDAGPADPAQWRVRRFVALPDPATAVAAASRVAAESLR
ncbi:MAG: hypothetical protein ACE367_25270 [Acidimicrobiales bacterium]